MTSVTASSSTQLQLYLREVESALRSQDTARAMRLSDEAVTKGFEHSHLFILAAHHNLAAGAIARALELAFRARDSSPRNVDALNVLGLALVKSGRAREAIVTYDAALRQTPGATVVRFNRACALEEARDLTHARNEFERIVEREPAHFEALARLADLAVRRGDAETSRICATRALRIAPNLAAAHLAVAQADLAQAKVQDAIVRLQSLIRDPALSAVNRSIAFGLLGDGFEKDGNFGEAFEAYAKSQSVLREHYRPVFENGQETALARAERLTDFYETHPLGRDGPPVAQAGPARTHVFLVGFPRSGTTLLEQALASHPDVQSMEERDCLIDAANDFAVQPNGPSRLCEAPPEALETYRLRYWERVAQEGISLDRPVFVDKLPLNTTLLGVIARLFPHARILFALRDPRDVVLSCFRRRFVMTPQMFELTSLEHAARYYAAVMRFGDIFRRRLGESFCDTRYEDLVGAFDAECSRICVFLGIGWNDSMRNFAERARAGIINTPSAPQVARGLFSHGIGQWRQYRTQLAPVMPLLKPWIAQFAYPTE